MQTKNSVLIKVGGHCIPKTQTEKLEGRWKNDKWSRR